VIFCRVKRDLFQRLPFSWPGVEEVMGLGIGVVGGDRGLKFLGIRYHHHLVVYLSPLC